MFTSAVIAAACGRLATIYFEHSNDVICPPTPPIRARDEALDSVENALTEMRK